MVDYSQFKRTQDAEVEYGNTQESQQIVSEETPDNLTASKARLALEGDTREEISNAKAIGGLATSLGVELGGGLYASHKISKARNMSRTLKALKAAKAVKTAAIAGVVTPEVGSTVLGAVGWAASEAAIWGIANWGGQSIRQGFGIQDRYSAGEGLAASLFGVGIVTAKATQVGQKVFNLSDGVGKMGAWKGMRTLGANFVSGAAIGGAESAMRQTVQIMLNERESYDKYDYILSTLIGGGANTLIGALTSAGAKGDEFMKEAHLRTKQSLQRQKELLIKQGKSKEARRVDDQISVLDDMQAQLDAQLPNENKLVEKSKFNQEDPRGAPEPVDDPEIKKPEIKPKKTDEPEVDPKETDKPKIEGGEEVETPIIEAKTERRTKIDNLANRFKNLTTSGYSAKEIVEEILPNFSREAAPIRDELHSEFNRKYKSVMRNAANNKGEAIQSELTELMRTMEDLTAFNDVRFTIETGAGRSLLGLKEGAERFAFTGLSERAVREQELLRRLQENISKLSKRQVLDDDILKIKDKYDNVQKDVTEDFKERQQVPLSKEKLSSKTYKELQVLAKEKGLKGNQKKDALITQLSEKAQAVSEEASITNIITAKIKNLQKGLDAERNRVVKMFEAPLNDKQRSAFAKKKEEALKSNPTIQDLETKTAYYKDLQRQLKLEEELNLELGQRANLEAEGSVTDLKKDVAKQGKKDELSTTPDSIKELRQKIADSKKRIRDKVKDLEVAESDIRYAEMMRDLEDWHYKSLDTEAGISWTKFGRGVREARRMALIDQLPSVMAGVPTGVGRLLVKDVLRPLVEYGFDAKAYGLSQANQIFKANYEGTFQSLLNWDGTGTAFTRSFKEAELVTTHAKNRYDDRVQTDTALRTIKNINAQKVRKHAETKRKATARFTDRAFNFNNLGDGMWGVLSLGVRGIGSVDEIFRRQVIRGRIHANAKKRAIIAHPDDLASQQKHFKEEMQRTWVRDDGLEVLDDYRNHQNVLNSMNRDLFFAAQGDDLDGDMFHKDSAEKLISKIKEVHNGDDELGFVTDMFLPYVSVPIRGAYLGGKLAVSPLMAFRGQKMNPYTKKIADRVKRMTDNQLQLRENELKLKDDSLPALDRQKIEADVKRYQDEIRQNDKEIEILEGRETHYKYEGYVDAVTGMALFGMGATMASNGQATGSLNFLTRDQQEKNKLKPFHGFNADYSAAAPWALPFALGADFALYQNIVNEEERSGVPIMKEGTTRIEAVFATLVELTEQVPLFEGIETLMSLVKSGPEAKIKQVSKLMQSYVPVPAFMRKAVKAYNDDTTIADLKGGTFIDRQFYYFFGVKPVNVKMDYFGFPQQKPTERIQYLIMRQIPKATHKFYNDFERVLAGDVYDDIIAKPSSQYGVKFHNYINDEGVTLNTAFNRKLRDFRFKYKNGKKVTLKEAIESKMSSRKWQALYNGRDAVKYDEITGKYSNIALKELNSIIRSYHTELGKKIFKDNTFTRSFVNKNNKTLKEMLLTREGQLQTQGGVIKPLRELLNFK